MIFRTILSETIEFHLEIFYTISVFNLIRQFDQKIITLLEKKFNWLVDLVFEICLDSKFPVQG